MKSGGGGLMPTLLNQGVHLEEMLFTVSKGLVLIAYIIIPMLIEKFFVSLFCLISSCCEDSSMQICCENSVLHHKIS